MAAPRPTVPWAGRQGFGTGAPTFSDSSRLRAAPAGSRGLSGQDSYLVDSASSHMLVSKIKPCMCKYKLFCTVKLRMAH